MTIAIRIVHRLTAGFALDIDLDLPAHGVTAIFGRSGAGKSTLLSAVAGFLSPEDGRISIDGTTLFDRASGTSLAPHRRRVAVRREGSREGRRPPLLPMRSCRPRGGGRRGWKGPARCTICAASRPRTMPSSERRTQRMLLPASSGSASWVHDSEGVCWISHGADWMQLAWMR